MLVLKPIRRRMAKCLPSCFTTCAMICVVLVFLIFFGDETSLRQVGTSGAQQETVSAAHNVINMTDPPRWVQMELQHFKDSLKRRKRKQPPPPEPSLTLKDMLEHIAKLREIMNMSRAEEDRGKEVFAHHYLRALAEEDLSPVPVSRVHNNRVVLNKRLAKIPNVVNLIHFNQNSEYDVSDYFTFVRYVTFKSVEKYIKGSLNETRKRSCVFEKF
jgi:hypothetical protein